MDLRASITSLQENSVEIPPEAWRGGTEVRLEACYFNDAADTELAT